MTFFANEDLDSPRLGLSSQLPDSTHPPWSTEPDPPLTELTFPTVGIGLLLTEPDFDRPDVGSPSSKSEKPDLTNPQIFRCYLINLVSFEMFFG